MRFGRTVEKGFLPIYSVDTEAEAKLLLAATCPKNLNGEYVAQELVYHQTLENLYAFGDRLHERWQFIQSKREEARGEVAVGANPKRKNKKKVEGGSGS